jgi:hypothetical protein
MTNFNASDHPRVADGSFTDKPQTAAQITLERVHRAPAADIQAFLDAEHRNHRAMGGTLEFAAQEDASWGSALDSLGQMPDDILEELITLPAADFRAAFATRAAREGLAAELPEIALRESNDWMLDAEDSQEPASLFLDERLTEFDHGHFSRADYAEVGSEGITYGININPEHLGSIVAGERLSDESEDEYMERVSELEPDYATQLSAFFVEEYGADLLTDGSDMDVVEFFIAYEKGGAQSSSIAYMGDRVEHETKLLAALNDWTYGSQMQGALAKKLGYSFRRSDNADRRIFDGGWVKDED